MSEAIKYTKKDFVSDQEVRWCPGCGDYSILASIQMTMPKIGHKKEDIVFVSGIGCSSRFPYYMNTFGLHTIHGRAPAFASGLKAQNPDLSVWVITGDGDGLSIGGNHLIHAIRRNLDINIIIFNNEIYGLTKGQYSPTSKVGTVTKSTPYGSIDRPFNVASLILGAGATFFARTMDTDLKHMQETFLEAANHKGTSVVEVLQNCIIFNDKVHDHYTNRSQMKEHTVQLKHGEPLIFGKERDKVLVKDFPTLKVKDLASSTQAQQVVHDQCATGPMAQMLAQICTPDMPYPTGVFRKVDAPIYETALEAQLEEAVAKQGTGSMASLLESGETWVVS